MNRPAQQRLFPPPRELFLPAIAILLATLFAAYYHLTVRLLPYDDAFITYRYIANANHGLGLVYNADERVFGVSTPLYLLWLLSLKKVFSASEIPVLSVRLNFIFFALTAWIVFVLLLRYTRRPWPAAIVASVLLISPDLLAISAGGMESFLFTFLLLAALLAANASRPALAGVLLGLPCIPRLEAFLFVPLIALALGFNWRRLLLAGTLAAIPILAWIIFATAYFGTPLPHSIVAKSKPIYPLPAGTCFVDTARHLGAYLTGWRLVRLQTIWGGAAVLIVLACGLITILRKPTRTSHSYQPAAVCLALLLFYLLGNPLAFAWYWPPITISALCAILLGLWSIPLRSHIARLALATACTLWLAGIVFPATSGPQLRAAWTAVEQDPSRRRISGYHAAAQLLNRIADAPVAAPEIGALGYYYHGKILDSCGLVSPEALPYLPIPRHAQVNPRVGAISLEFVEALRPPWIATLRCFCERSLLPSQSFARDYELVDSVPLEVPYSGSDRVLLYRRRAAH